MGSFREIAEILGVDTEQVVRCTRKTAYRDRVVANRVREKQQPNTAKKLTVYKCPYCGSWHVGGRTR